MKESRGRHRDKNKKKRYIWREGEKREKGRNLSHKRVREK
jgi:hypothetical protein